MYKDFMFQANNVCLTARTPGMQRQLLTADAHAGWTLLSLRLLWTGTSEYVATHAGAGLQLYSCQLFEKENRDRRTVRSHKVDCCFPLTIDNESGVNVPSIQHRPLATNCRSGLHLHPRPGCDALDLDRGDARSRFAQKAVCL